MNINKLTTLKCVGLTLAFTSFLACNNSHPTTDSASNIVTQETPILDTVISEILNESALDTLVLDSTYFPSESQKSFMNLKTVGIFHSDEFSSEDMDRNWMGIFKNEDSTYITDALLDVSRINDPVLDDDDQQTGWEIKTVNQDECILLIEQSDWYESGKIDAINFDENQIFPKDTIRFKHNDHEYSLYAIGVYENEAAENAEWPIFYNYKLYLTINPGYIANQSLIAAIPRFDDAMVELLFCGDIDNDGFLDFIFNTSAHYNETAITLYLSWWPYNYPTVRPVGSHFSVGC
ncbi:MAG: hypothetical protein GQ574_23510 [Crocinitomix sp.]|nr:hypothetical protein [Crocinitomix sp.]